MLATNNTLPALLGREPQALAAIHDFEPALPWGIYAQTQAPLHEFVMNRFREYLQRYTARRLERRRKST